MIVELLKLIFTTAFPGESLGIAPVPISAAQARLSLALPEALKDFYNVACASLALQKADYRILPPQELRVDGDHLIFCEEREGQEVFGITLANITSLGDRPNPSVGIRRKGESKWFGEASRLSAFMLGMTAWQVAQLLPHKARVPYPDHELKKLLPYFEPVGEPKVRLGAQFFALVDHQRSIVAAYSNTSEMLYVGAPRANAISELERSLGLDFAALLEKRSRPRKVGPLPGEVVGSESDQVRTIIEPLERLVTTAFPDESLGMANEPIAAAEARLGLVLPEPLRNFFAVAGGSQDLLNADYIFLPPEKLRVDDNHLIFCEERQGQEDFGIALANIAALGERPNPPVNVRPKGRVEWLVAEEGTLSAFLLGMTAWQVALMLPERARCPVPEVDLPKLLAFFEPVGAPLIRVGASRFGLIDRKRSIVAAYCCADEVLYLGTPHEDVLEKLEQKAGLELESL